MKNSFVVLNLNLAQRARYRHSKCISHQKETLYEEYKWDVKFDPLAQNIVTLKSSVAAFVSQISVPNVLITNRKPYIKNPTEISNLTLLIGQGQIELWRSKLPNIDNIRYQLITRGSARGYITLYKQMYVLKLCRRDNTKAKSNVIIISLNLHDLPKHWDYSI